MLRPPRRALPALAALSALALAGCGGAGYGEPVAGGDGSATVALAPAPVTTPGVTTTETGSSGSAADEDATTDGGGRSTSATTGGSSSGSAGGSAADAGRGSDSGSGSGSGDSAGSGGSGGGSTLAAYSADANRFCTGFNTATKALAVEIGAADPNDPKPLGRAIIRYGTAIDDAAEGLRGASPPSSVSSYHQRTLSWVSGVTSAIDANRSGLSSGDKSAGATVIQRVQGLGRPPSAPSSLRARATACTA